MAVIERDAVPENLPVQAAVVSDTTALMRVIERAALDPNFDVAKLHALIDVKERWDKLEAKKAYDVAMAEFKRNPPQIVKDMHVAYANKGGGITEYDHESIGRVCAAVIPALAAVGITHKWDPEQRDGMVKITCVLTHALGHSERTPLHSGEDHSGGKNDIQAIASAVKYLERYTLLAAIGIAPMDRDDDGHLSGKPRADGNGERTAPKFITEKQVADLDALIQEVKANKQKFLKHIRVEQLSDLRTDRYSAAVKALEAKRRQ